jgi:hypothetical protein
MGLDSLSFTLVAMPRCQNLVSDAVLVTPLVRNGTFFHCRFLILTQFSFGEVGVTCPTAPGGWDPWIYNAASVVVDVNWYNTSSYNWRSYNTSDSASLFGSYINLVAPGWYPTPKSFNVSSNSVRRTSRTRQRTTKTNL